MRVLLKVTTTIERLNDYRLIRLQMLSAESGDTAGVHKSANGNNDEGGAAGANDCGNGDGIRATAASPYSSQVSKVSTPGSEGESTGSLKRFYRSARHR